MIIYPPSPLQEIKESGDQGVRSQGEIICIFPVTSHLSPVTCHQSPVTCHQSPVT
ncbi:hypothetical protein PN497_11385 [Sphaerospermopsis kisseleviana CS-549]|uniref:Uncharacterized protein n=1 Tax=Sphaerospermopsis kisseleviana CS-549 TaxID=3021783 RepID=A0ABT4ZRC7_9CYAN|nr:hypothetical protein [Sphaerospermopsis kisseleviana]MDB9441958.1 hypothetical protein [Sphaerospermopsis kisseleviana CS-549]